jgi:hypothetical protein
MEVGHLDITFIISIALFIGGSFVGLAALRKSGSEASKSSSEAAAVIAGASADIVTQLRDQMADLNNRLTDEECQGKERAARIDHLEDIVETWENWANRVLAILDRSLSMLAPEQAVKLEPEVKTIKGTKPVVKRARRAYTSSEEEEKI